MKDFNVYALEAPAEIDAAFVTAQGRGRVLLRREGLRDFWAGWTGEGDEGDERT